MIYNVYFFEKMFIQLLNISPIGRFCNSLTFNSIGLIKYVSLINQPCQDRPKPVDINSDKTLFYPFTVIFNKRVGSCNTIDDP